MTSLTTDQKGQIAVLKVMIEAERKGALVLLPARPTRYDLGLDYQGKFYRVQVKYAAAKLQHATGGVYVDLRRRKRCYTRDEIDVLLVYVAELDRICWFSPEAFHNRGALHLRLRPTLNGQRKGCWLAEDYFW